MIVRKLTLATAVAFSTMVAGLALSGTAALAAAPEAPGPVTVQSPVGATKATVHGVLSPHAEGHPGTYEFLYKKGSSGCEGEAVAPESPGIMLGGEAEEVSQELAGLEPATKYAVCLRAETKGGTTVGPAVTFTTARALEAPTTTSPAGDVAATTATLLGVLNPSAPAEAGERYEFRYRASATECQGENEIATPREEATGAKGDEVEAKLTELQPSRQYTFCVIAINATEETAAGAPVTFTTSGAAPMVEGESFSEVGPTGASVTGQVNTENREGVYFYEYGPASTFASEPAKSVEVDLPASGSPVAAPARLTGLQAGVEYEFRLVARNATGEVGEGAVIAFSTLPAANHGLPDGRVYETVSEAENPDAEAYVPEEFAKRGIFNIETTEYGLYTSHPFEASVSGGRVAYVGSPDTTSGTGERGAGNGNEFLATRGVGGWTESDLQPPGYGLSAGAAPFQAFSSDLSAGILTVASSEYLPPLTPEAPGKEDRVPYLRDNTTGSYSPLFTSTPPNLSGGSFAAWEGEISGTSQPPRFGGASADFGDLTFEANDALAPNAVYGSYAENNLYLSSAGQVTAVNVLPGATVSRPGAVFGGPSHNENVEVMLAPDLDNVVSSDGSRIFWSTLSPRALYVRENAGTAEAVTVQLDRVQGGSGSSGGGQFWAASSTGSVVFFTDESELTEDSTAAAGAPDLYEYDVETGRLSDLTVDGSPGEPADVQGVLGASEDGAYVYFAADGKLAAGATSGEPNVYVLHDKGGSWEAAKLVATLNPEDGLDVHPHVPAHVSSKPVGDWIPTLDHRTAEVSADGLGLVFASDRSIPVVGFPGGYRNDGLDEIYAYQDGEGAGRLFCVSCSSSGEPPQQNYETEQGEAAAFVPGGFDATRQLRWVSEDGSRVFFDSAEPLVTTDTNGEQDVYEWERDGAGSCRQAAGCVYLISDGIDKSASYFLDASANGDDVFIITRARLTPAAAGEEYNVFDARVGGSQPVVAPACTGTGCQGVPAPPPTFATPPSATFAGVGNFVASAPVKPAVKPKPKPKSKSCRKGYVKKHGKCVKKRSVKKRVRATRKAGR